MLALNHLTTKLTYCVKEKKRYLHSLSPTFLGYYHNLHPIYLLEMVFVTLFGYRLPK